MTSEEQELSCHSSVTEVRIEKVLLQRGNPLIGVRLSLRSKQSAPRCCCCGAMFFTQPLCLRQPSFAERCAYTLGSFACQNNEAALLRNSRGRSTKLAWPGKQVGLNLSMTKTKRTLLRQIIVCLAAACYRHYAGNIMDGAQHALMAPQPHSFLPLVGLWSSLLPIRDSPTSIVCHPLPRHFINTPKQ